jgi:hypothetical protein
MSTLLHLLETSPILSALIASEAPSDGDPRHFMVDTYCHEGKETFLDLLKVLPSEDLKDASKTLFSVGLNALFAGRFSNTDVVIFNNLLQREYIQNFLAREYLWNDPKLFCLEPSQFDAFIQNFFAGALTAEFSEQINHRFRGDLIRDQLLSLKDGKEWLKYAEERLMHAIFSLEDKAIKRAVLTKSLDSSGSLAAFLSGAEYRRAMTAELDILQGKTALCLGKFSVYTSSYWDQSYSAEKADKAAEAARVYAAL